MGQSWAYRRVRSEHATLFVAIMAVLAAGIVSAILIPVAPGGRFARENGALLAPPSDEAFSSALGAPAVPSSSIGADQASARQGSEQSAPSRPKPSPAPGPDTPPPPGSHRGVLELLDDLIPPPPPLPIAASARAVERVTSTR